MKVIDRQRAVEACYLIPGWCYPRELGALYDLFAGSTLHVELGTFCGKSLFVTGQTMADRGLLICVDPLDFASPGDHYHIPSADWVERVLGATTIELCLQRPDLVIKKWRTLSLDAARQMQAFKRLATSIYFDWAKEYAETLQDLEAWYCLMAPGAVMMGHDYWPVHQGVIAAVEEFFGVRQLAFEIVPQTRLWWHRVPG